MAIGIVDDKDFELEWKKLNGIHTSDNANSNSNPSSNLNEEEEEGATIIDIQRGRGEGKLEVPDSLRKVIGEDALENGRSSGQDLARAVGISDSSLSAYTKGATSTTTYNEPDKNLGDHIDKVRKRIGQKARGRLIMAMNSITKDKLESAKLRDVASVANAMSNVIRNIEGPTDSNNNQTNFIFYAPKTKTEESFEVINLKE